MLTTRDLEAGKLALKKILGASIDESHLDRAVAAVILAVDAERSPVKITKDILGSIFAPPFKG